MAKNKNQKTSREKQQRRTYQVVFVAISVIVLLTMVLSLMR